MNRHYVGIERETIYIEAAKRRIDSVQIEFSDLIDNAFDVKPPRFSIKQLVQLGYLSVGQKIYSKDRRNYAEICEDGNVQDGETKSSIHKMSAKFLKRSNNNGWDYFWCEYNGDFVSIDSLRYLANEKGGIK